MELLEISYSIGVQNIKEEGKKRKPVKEARETPPPDETKPEPKTPQPEESED